MSLCTSERPCPPNTHNLQCGAPRCPYAQAQAAKRKAKPRVATLRTSVGVTGCKDCGKPAALDGDTIPADGLCQWCTDEVRPARATDGP